MLKTVTATQARIRFGELMRLAQDSPIIVERDGKAQVVVLSKQAFDQLAEGASPPGWREVLAQAQQYLRHEIASRSAPSSAAVGQVGEERTHEYHASPETVLSQQHERISIDPATHHGEACIKGTRIPVSVIVASLADGLKSADILENYPQLCEADILAALAYAAEIAQQDIFLPL